jgi:hypothetical protein
VHQSEEMEQCEKGNIYVNERVDGTRAILVRIETRQCVKLVGTSRAV